MKILSQLFFLFSLISSSLFVHAATKTTVHLKILSDEDLLRGARNFKIVAPSHNPTYPSTLDDLALKNHQTTAKTFILRQALIEYKSILKLWVQDQTPPTNPSTALEAPSPSELFKIFRCDSLKILSKKIPLAEGECIEMRVSFISVMFSQLTLKLEEGDFVDESAKLLQNRRKIELKAEEIASLLGVKDLNSEVFKKELAQIKKAIENDLLITYWESTSRVRNQGDSQISPEELFTQLKPRYYSFEERYKTSEGAEKEGIRIILQAFLAFHKNTPIPEGRNFFLKFSNRDQTVEFPFYFVEEEEVQTPREAMRASSDVSS